MRPGSMALALLVVLTLAACGDAVFVAQNARLDPALQCAPGGVDKIAVGVLDLSDTYPMDPIDGASPQLASTRRYLANFVVEKADSDDRKLVVEQIDLRYSFMENTVVPNQSTIEAIPALFSHTVSASLGPDTRASKDSPAGTALVSVELISTEVAAALAGDTSIESMLLPPNRYPLTVEVRLSGRFVGGGEFLTSFFSFPVELCKGCLVFDSNCRTTCYEPWQDCR